MPLLDAPVRPVSRATGWCLVALALLLLSALRGVRYPNMWSFAHYLFNYDFGLLKRSLLGAFTAWLDVPWLQSYGFFTGLSLAILALNLGLLACLLKRLIDNGELGGALVFASSLGATLLAHTAGYADQFGVSILLITVLLGGFVRKLVFAAPAFAVALFIHEGQAVMFFPGLFMVLMLAAFREERRLGKLLVLGWGLLCLIGVRLLGETALTPEQVEAMYQGLQQHSAIPLRRDAFGVLARPASDSLGLMWQVWSGWNWQRDFIFSALAVLPALLALLFLLHRCLRRAGYGWLWQLGFVGAALAPLLMHAIAWDLQRWNGLALFTCVVMLGAVQRLGPMAVGAPVPVPIPDSATTAAPALTLAPVWILLIFLNGISTVGLLDDYKVGAFPFEAQQRYLFELSQHPERFPFIPLR